VRPGETLASLHCEVCNRLGHECILFALPIHGVLKSDLLVGDSRHWICSDHLYGVWGKNFGFCSSREDDVWADDWKVRWYCLTIGLEQGVRDGILTLGVKWGVSRKGVINGCCSHHVHVDRGPRCTVMVDCSDL